MPFNAQDLMTSIQAFGEGKDKAWVVVIGCGPASVECPKTQPTGLLRNQPIDFQGNPQAIEDLLYLKQALKAKLSELKTLEVNLSPPERQRFDTAEQKLLGGQIQELMLKGDVI